MEYYPYTEHGERNWDYPNTDPSTSEKYPTYNTHSGIYYGDSASLYTGMNKLEVPTLNAEELAKGYEFKGWSLVGDSSGTIYSSEDALAYIVRGDTTFRAEWETPVHTVTFKTNKNLGTLNKGNGVEYSYQREFNNQLVDDIPAAYGKDYSEQYGSGGVDPETGEYCWYEFVGWYDDLSGNVIPDSELRNTKIDRDLTYYAKYKRHTETVIEQTYYCNVRYVPGANGTFNLNLPGYKDDYYLPIGSGVSAWPAVVPNQGWTYTGKWTVKSVDYRPWPVDYPQAYEQAQKYSEGAYNPKVGDVLTESQIASLVLFYDIVLEPVYEAKDDATYTVTYNDGVGNTAFMPVVFTDLQKGTVTPMAGVPAVWERSGDRYYYLLAGWTPEVSANVTENAVYTANWKAIPKETYQFVTVTYTDGIGGKAFADQVAHCRIRCYWENGEYGYEFPFTPDFQGTPSRKGYTFGGWSPEVTEKAEGNAIYTAVWIPDEDTTFTVTYNDGMGGKAQVYKDLAPDSSTPKYEGILDRPGYRFICWDPLVENKVTDDAVYTAVWEKKDYYTVIYTDGAGGTVFMNEIHGGLEKESETPQFYDTLQRKGYDFIGWSPNVKQRVEEDIIYTACWEPVESAEDCTVVYADGAGGTAFKPQTFTGLKKGDPTPEYTGGTRAAGVKPERDGYTFIGWSPVVSETVEEDVIYTACWEKDVEVVVIYTDGAGGEAFKTQVSKVPAGDPTPAFEGGTPERKDYTFIGWSPEVQDTADGDITYTALWVGKSSPSLKYTVKYLPGENGSLAGTDTLSVKGGSFIPTIPTVSPEESYKYKGKWLVTSVSEGAEDIKPGDIMNEIQISRLQINYDVTFEAQYEKETFTVIYKDGVGNTAFERQTNSELEKGTATPAFNGTPERKGYKFICWDPVVDEKVTRNAVYTAVWEKTTDTTPASDNKGGTSGGGSSSGQSGKSSGVSAAKTSDSHEMNVWIALMAACAAALMAAAVIYRKKSKI